MNIITSAFLAARPKTLTASLIPVWAGCMVVQKLTGSWNASLALLTLTSCLCLQIACNFFNDAIDHAKHADTERRTGPVRDPRWQVWAIENRPGAGWAQTCWRPSSRAGDRSGCAGFRASGP